MNILKDFPPNIEKIRKAFPIQKNTVFTYGDTIYAPGITFTIPRDLIEHEGIHMAQQGKDPERWWDRYILDTQFRFDQEIQAYQHQYRYYCKFVKSRDIRFEFLKSIAWDLSGPLYGNMISFRDAIAVIKS